YVNSRKTPPNEFDNSVRSELSHRVQQVVYVEAGSDVRWTDVATVIDIVEGLDAEVVLSTIPPKIR
ncbi:MAG: hypothetical protein WB510_01790, partial [Candidatus Sulfotelmatobacter sp.]